jgi:3-dehydroquinate synthase
LFKLLPEKVRVRLKTYPYDVVYVAKIAAIAEQIPPAQGRQFALIDANVDKYYGKALRKALQHISFLRIPSGESGKSFRSLEGLANELVLKGATRSSSLIAIGGGVVGDLTGFLSGVFMRGIPFVQIPTTLLAMVDSSVGGKTAVNIATGKNLVGVFHQPQKVIIVPSMLSTLPAREMRCGLSESIKTALIANPRLVRYLEDVEYPSDAFNPDFWHGLSAACIRIKADIVAKDEKEQNIRAFLNLGHTLAHAIETSFGYKSILHGEAVALGQRFAALVSRRLGLLSQLDEQRIASLLRKYGLPTGKASRFAGKSIAAFKASSLLQLMRADKKNQSKAVRMVLLTGIGSPQLPVEVKDQELLASLKEFQTLA